MPKVRFLAKAAFVTGCSFFLPSDVVSAQDRGQLFGLLSTRDPLSCALHGTSTDLCAGPAGAWQVGRLALSVEATAKALELAGIGFDSRDVQAMIYRDGAESGFDLALVTPTIAMIDIAALGPSGPFGENAEAIGSLSTLALESLYPGIAEQLGYGELVGLPGVEPNGGFSGFPDFAASFGGMQPDQAQHIEFDKFLPVRHPALSRSAPILQLIPSTIEPFGSMDNVVGGSPNDFLFSHHPNSDTPILNEDSPFGGLPVSMAYTDYLAQSYGAATDYAPEFDLMQESPFGGAACLVCTTPGATTPPGTPFAEHLTGPNAPNPAEDELSGGQFVDNLASADQNAAASTDTRNDDGSGAPGAAEKGMKEIGKRAARKGIAVYIGSKVGGWVGEKIAKYGGGGPVGAGIAVFDLFQKTACDPGEVSKACGNANEEPNPTPVTGADPKDPKGSNDPEQPDPIEPKDPKGTNDPGDPDHGSDGSGTDGQNSSAGATRLTVPEDQDPPLAGDSNGGPGLPPQGPDGCSPDQFLSVTFCTDPIYGPSEYSCFADERGEVGCFGPNVLVRSVAPEGPLFTMYQNGNQSRMLRLDEFHQDILSGDLVQASLIAALDHERFSMDKFVPMRDGGSALRPINEILQHQSKDLFESGFGSNIGISINPDGSTDLHNLGPVTVGIEGGSVRFGDGFPDTLPAAPRQ